MALDLALPTHLHMTQLEVGQGLRCKDWRLCKQSVTQTSMMFISPRRLDGFTCLLTQTRHSKAPRPPTLTCLLKLKCIQTFPLIHRLLESGNLPKLLLQLAGLLRPASILIVFAVIFHVHSCGSYYARACWYPAPVAYV